MLHTLKYSIPVHFVLLPTTCVVQLSLTSRSSTVDKTRIQIALRRPSGGHEPQYVLKAAGFCLRQKTCSIERLSTNPFEILDSCIQLHHIVILRMDRDDNFEYTYPYPPLVLTNSPPSPVSTPPPPLPLRFPSHANETPVVQGWGSL